MVSIYYVHVIWLLKLAEKVFLLFNISSLLEDLVFIHASLLLFAEDDPDDADFEPDDDDVQLARAVKKVIVN